MPDILGIIDNISRNIANSIGGTIQDVLGKINNKLNNYVLYPISNDVSNVFNSIDKSVTALETNASQSIKNAVYDVGNTLSSIENNVISGFDNGIRSISNAITTIGGSIVNTFTNIIKSIATGFNSVKTGVEYVVTGFAKTVSQALEIYSKNISNEIVKVITPLVSFIDQIPKDIETIPIVIKSGFKEWSDTVHEVIKLWATNIEKPALVDLVKIWNDKTTKKELEVLKVFKPNIIGVFDNITGFKLSDIPKESFERLAGTVIAEAGLGILSKGDQSLAYIISGIINQISRGLLIGTYRDIEQAGNDTEPNRIFDVGVLVDGKYRGVIKDKEYYKELSKGGFDKGHADQLYSIGNMLLAVNDLISLYRRGYIKDIQELYDKAIQVRADKGQVDALLNLYNTLLNAGESIEMWRRNVLPENWNTHFDDLIRSGVTLERIQALKDISYTLPSIFQYQDLTVRKVTDKNTVNKYKLDYLLDDNYLNNAKANGYDEKTAIELYRSYWELPPFFIVEGLFSRGKFSEKDFRDVLAFERYTPYWIDRLVENLKPTLTTGDIKDLYKYQVISKSEIIPHLLSIGIPKDLATQYSELWEASIKLAEPLHQTGQQIKAIKMKGDTEALIKTAYKDKVISRKEAEAALIKINVESEAAALILDIIDYEIQQQSIRDEYELVSVEFKAKSITLNQALNMIQKAGATADQLTIYNSKLQRSGKIRTRTPTLSEFEKWFKKGIISIVQFVEGLSMLGYGNNWIPYYLMINGVSEKEIIKLGFSK